MNEIKRVKLFVKENDFAKEASHTVKEKLQNHGYMLVEDDFDLGIAVGGDGTFLKMVKETNFREDVFYVGVNAGTLGFAQDISMDELDSFLENLKKEEFYYEEIGIQEVEVQAKNETHHFCSINEMVVREIELNAIHLDIYVENRLLENYVGDGILISTSFGSTAYNRSFGGSIVYNTFHTLQITPIAPINNKQYQSLTNSVIIPSEKEITLIPKEKTQDCIINVDGDYYRYQGVEKIKTSIQQKRVKVIRKQDYNFIKKVNEKLLK